MNADAQSFLPPTRTPSRSYEYKTLLRAFHKEISPHIDQEMARRVLDTNWLPDRIEGCSSEIGQRDAFPVHTR